MNTLYTRGMVVGGTLLFYRDRSPTPPLILLGSKSAKFGLDLHVKVNIRML